LPNSQILTFIFSTNFILHFLPQNISASFILRFSSAKHFRNTMFYLVPSAGDLPLKCLTFHYGPIRSDYETTLSIRFPCWQRSLLTSASREQSDLIRNEYFGSEIRTNPIGFGYWFRIGFAHLLFFICQFLRYLVPYCTCINYIFSKECIKTMYQLQATSVSNVFKY
jgi:hypothetical protein